LSLYGNWIGNDLVLHSLGREAALAGVASFVEGASLWAVVTLVPRASLAMIFPVLVVGLIYQVGHFQEWSRFDALLLLLFQFVVCFLVMSLYAGHFAAAVIVLGISAGVLALLGFFSKGL